MGWEWAGAFGLKGMGWTQTSFFKHILWNTYLEMNNKTKVMLLDTHLDTVISHMEIEQHIKKNNETNGDGEPTCVSFSFQ